MSGFFQNLLTDATGAFFGSDFLRDYTHASKTFRPNAYENAPKFKFLFHVYFELNPTLGNIVTPLTTNYGLLVKTVKLPSFTFDTTTLNQYNRKRLIQSKIKYDPVNITFHDDNGNAIRKLWKGYYNYYYADGTKPQVVFNGARGATPQTQYNGGGGVSGATDTYNNRTQYQPSITGNDSWGYQGTSGEPTGVKIPFFKNITIFGFNQHNFVAYTLINPIITTFSHDTYSYAEGNGTMEHQMSLEYETVVYNEGAVDGQNPSNIVTGFGDETHYDRTLSPIARPGSNANILGQGGLVAGAGGFIDALEQGNILGAIQAAGTTYNTFKDTNILNIAKSEAVAGLSSALTGTPNRNTQGFAIPKAGALPSYIGVAGSLLAGAQAKPAPAGGNFAGQQVP
jgi:hypothetical protein